MSKLTLALTIAVLSGSAVVGQDLRIGESCDLSKPGGTDKASFLAFDRELRAGLSREDPVIVSLLVGFPLRVNGDGSTIQITNANSLQARFQDIFPPAIRSAVLDQTVESISCSFSGIMYGNGQVWIQVTMQGRYQISTINLPRTESRPQAFPKLDFFCDAEKHRIVIDLDSGGTPRYRAWNKPRSVAGPPDIEIATGTKSHEGTGPCAHSVWEFHAADAGFTLMTHGCSPDSSPPPERSRGSLIVTAATGERSHWWCY